MSETWRKIIQSQEEIKRQRETALKQEKFETELTESQEKNVRESKEIEEGGIRAERLVTSILEEIRKNSKEIRQARFNKIYTNLGLYYGHYCDKRVYLTWGNKSGLTREERQILDEYHIIDDKKRKQAERLPASFIGEDFYLIGTDIYEYGGNPACTNFPKYITDPDFVISNLANQLMNPERHLRKYVKGLDYWRPPYPPADHSMANVPH